MKDNKIEEFVSVNLNSNLSNNIHINWSVSLVEDIPIEKVKTIITRNYESDNALFNNFSIKDYLRRFDTHFLFSDLNIFDNASQIIELMLDNDDFFYISDSQISKLSIYINEATKFKLLERYIELSKQFTELNNKVENFDLFWNIFESGDNGIRYYISYLNTNYEMCDVAVFENSTINALRLKSKSIEFMRKNLCELVDFKNEIGNSKYKKNERLILQQFIEHKHKAYLEEKFYRSEEAKANSIEFNKQMNWIAQNPEI